MSRFTYPMRGLKVKGELVVEDNSSQPLVEDSAECFYLRAFFIWDSGECTLPLHVKRLLGNKYKIVAEGFDDEFILFNTEKEMEHILFVFIKLWFGVYG